MALFWVGVWGGVTACLAISSVVLFSRLREALETIRIYEAMSMRPIVAAFTDQQITDLANQLMGRMTKKEWIQ